MIRIATYLLLLIAMMPGVSLGYTDFSYVDACHIEFSTDHLIESMTMCTIASIQSLVDKAFFALIVDNFAVVIGVVTAIGIIIFAIRIFLKGVRNAQSETIGFLIKLTIISIFCYNAEFLFSVTDYLTNIATAIGNTISSAVANESKICTQAGLDNVFQRWDCILDSIIPTGTIWVTFLVLGLVTIFFPFLGIQLMLSVLLLIFGLYIFLLRLSVYYITGMVAVLFLAVLFIPALPLWLFSATEKIFKKIFLLALIYALRPMVVTMYAALIILVVDVFHERIAKHMEVLNSVDLSIVALAGKNVDRGGDDFAESPQYTGASSITSAGLGTDIAGKSWYKSNKAVAEGPMTSRGVINNGNVTSRSYNLQCRTGEYEFNQNHNVISLPKFRSGECDKAVRIWRKYADGSCRSAEVFVKGLHANNNNDVEVSRGVAHQLGWNEDIKHVGGIYMEKRWKRGSFLAGCERDKTQQYEDSSLNGVVETADRYIKITKAERREDSVTGKIGIAADYLLGDFKDNLKLSIDTLIEMVQDFLLAIICIYLMFRLSDSIVEISTHVMDRGDEARQISDNDKQDQTIRQMQKGVERFAKKHSGKATRGVQKAKEFAKLSPEQKRDSVKRAANDIKQSFADKKNQMGAQATKTRRSLKAAFLNRKRQASRAYKKRFGK